MYDKVKKQLYHHNPNQTQRKNLRLKNYDYSKVGLYFITISTQNKLCLFWKIENNKIDIFESGKMIENYWLELENKFDNIKLHNFVVMPNHFHWILEIVETNKNCDCKICRGTPCGYPDNNVQLNKNDNENIDNVNSNIQGTHVNSNIQGTHKGCPYNKLILWNIIWWFKSETTNVYIKLVYQNKAKSFNKKLWQRNFYDNVIRKEEQYLKISKYIDENVFKWKEDKFYYTEV